MSASIGAAIIMAGLAAFGFVQARLATNRATIARAGELAAQAVSERDQQFDLSLLLSVEAIRTMDTVRTRNVLLDNTQTNPFLLQYLRGHTKSVYSLAFSPDGKTLASGNYANTVFLWDVTLQSWIDLSCQRAARNFTQKEWTQYFPDEKYRTTCPQWPAGN